MIVHAEESAMRYPVLDMQATGSRIRELRQMHKISIQTLRENMQLESVQAIYKWERGASVPRLDNLILLSKILETPIESILVIHDDE